MRLRKTKSGLTLVLSLLFKILRYIVDHVLNPTSIIFQRAKGSAFIMRSISFYRLLYCFLRRHKRIGCEGVLTALFAMLLLFLKTEILS